MTLPHFVMFKSVRSKECEPDFICEKFRFLSGYYLLTGFFYTIKNRFACPSAKLA